MRRQSSRNGLSYFEANRGRLVTYGPDVLKVKEEIEARWPGVLSAFFDTESDEWVIVEHCKDSRDRVVFTTPRMNMDVITRLQRFDQMTKHTDPLKELEREDAQLEKEKDHRFSESIGEAGERLYAALRKDGAIHRPQVFFSS